MAEAEVETRRRLTTLSAALEELVALSQKSAGEGASLWPDGVAWGEQLLTRWLLTHRTLVPLLSISPEGHLRLEWKPEPWHITMDIDLGTHSAKAFAACIPRPNEATALTWLTGMSCDVAEQEQQLLSFIERHAAAAAHNARLCPRGWSGGLNREATCTCGGLSPGEKPAGAAE